MEFNLNLSALLDEAKAKEEAARDQLLYWKQRRQELEAQIPRLPFWVEIQATIEEAWRNVTNN
jgi:hypothetical protein